MALKIKIRRFTLGLSLILLIAATLLPYSVFALGLPAEALPDIRSFTLALKNGDAKSLRGVYVENIFAMPVVQQPSSNAGFVSRTPNTVTEFGLAAQFGNIGLLAHNTLAGQYFSELYPGQNIRLIYGDGHTLNFRVTNVYRYQALSPFSWNSEFTDLDTHITLTAPDLFTKVYKGDSHLTLQTCIANNGNLSWGRLFIIAEPVDSLPGLSPQSE